MATLLHGLAFDFPISYLYRHNPGGLTTLWACPTVLGVSRDALSNGAELEQRFCDPSIARGAIPMSWVPLWSNLPMIARQSNILFPSERWRCVQCSVHYPCATPGYRTGLDQCAVSICREVCQLQTVGISRVGSCYCHFLVKGSKSHA